MALEADYPRGRPPAIRVLAEDRLQDLRMTRRTRCFEQLADRDIFEQIARDHGLTAEVDVDGGTQALVAQVNQSDLAFLRERARAIGAEVWVDDTTLHVQARARRDAGSLTLTYGQRLRELSVRADLAHQRTSVAVGGWDPGGKAAIDESADGAAIQSELGDGEGGPAVLESALGERPERIVGPLALSQAEAQLLAQSALRERARRFVTGSGEAEGDGRLRVGAEVGLEGLGPLFDGAYSVVETLHLFRVERPWLGRP
jgi:phage protein D